MCYLDDIVNDVDSGNCMDVNYVDCEKAFDHVPHQSLNKLGAVGITGNILRWINRFLTGRNTRSDWLPVMSGVLGLILFLVYINNTVINTEASVSLFADDAKIYRATKLKTDVKILHGDMEKLDECSRR